MVVLGYISLAAATFFSFSTLVAAVPISDPTTPPNRFTVQQKLNTKYKKSGSAALAKSFAKYNGTSPAIAPTAAAAGGENGTVVNTPSSQDSEYLIPVTVGGQELSLDLDTGSSDLWVFSTALRSSQTAGHTTFNPALSKTFKQLSGSTFSIHYGDNSAASGVVGVDTVDIGGVTVASQAVELAQSVTAGFIADTALDGLIGLAFSSGNQVSPKKQKTFFDNALASLDQGVFTADLRHNEPGTYEFGFIDSTKHTGPVVFTPVDNSASFWQFTATVGGSPITGIADTGTTLMLLDPAIVNQYYSGVTGAQLDKNQGGVVFPCDTQLPDFVMTVEDTDMTVSGEFINFAPADQAGTTCFGGIQSNNGLGLNVFGDVMFKSLFMVFDGENTQLGFAQK